MVEEQKNILNIGGKTLISVINAYLQGKPIPEIKDYKGVYVAAKRHSLGNMLYFALQGVQGVPDVVKDTLQQHFYSQTAQQMMQEYYSAKVFEEFENKKIKYMPLKGYYLRKLYPQPEMRTSCDVDIFYDEKRKDEVDAILKEMGFNWIVRNTTDDHWERESITLEMHYNLASDREYYYEYYKDVWERLKTDNGVKYEFTPEDYYIHFIVHAAKHFNHGGFGIRTVLDDYFYVKNTKLDRGYLDKEFKELKLTKFVSALEKLARVWFGGEKTDEQTEILGDYIIDAATYGTNANSVVIKNMIPKQSAKKAKFKFYLKIVFLNYSAMKEKYPILKPLPFLLPFAWIYRFFVTLFKKKNKIKEFTDKANELNKENIQRTEQIYDITETPRD